MERAWLSCGDYATDLAAKKPAPDEARRVRGRRSAGSICRRTNSSTWNDLAAAKRKTDRNWHWNHSCGCQQLDTPRRLPRRQLAAGFGSLALAGLLADESRRRRANPLAAAPAPFRRPRQARHLSVHARRPVAGGHVRLQAAAGARPRQAAAVRQAARRVGSQTGNLLQVALEVQPVRPERRLGQRAVSPRRRPCRRAVHDPFDARLQLAATAAALLELHTGSDTFVRPSMGSWITYGLGTENQDLPGFITICPTLTHGGVNNYSSAFLPAVYQGTALGNASTPAEQAKIPLHRNQPVAARLQRLAARLAAAR